MLRQAQHDKKNHRLVILSLSKDDAPHRLMLLRTSSCFDRLMLRQAQHDKKSHPLVILSLSKDDRAEPTHAASNKLMLRTSSCFDKLSMTKKVTPLSS
jgi:hypothetical protein